ncbi:hypothetical protein ACFO5K_08015 [Nocardia halotolerans]|uniref:Uncharacterized protein n=1 Tax=Nocardia halotolerans TaxID=1755878 RepID=A0ABV8VDG5_9NOCA
MTGRDLAFGRYRDINAPSPQNPHNALRNTFFAPFLAGFSAHPLRCLGTEERQRYRHQLPPDSGTSSTTEAQFDEFGVDLSIITVAGEAQSGGQRFQYR